MATPQRAEVDGAKKQESGKQELKRWQAFRLTTRSSANAGFAKRPGDLADLEFLNKRFIDEASEELRRTANKMIRVVGDL